MGDDWNKFMQSGPVRTALYAVCAVFSGFYAASAVMDIVSPNESSLMLIEQIGQTGYIAMSVVRALVCAWAAIAFARLAVKVFTDKDK